MGVHLRTFIYVGYEEDESAVSSCIIVAQASLRIGTLKINNAASTEKQSDTQPDESRVAFIRPRWISIMQLQL